MFSIDVDNREYWLTAKHILTGRKTGPAGEVMEKNVSLDVLDPVGRSVEWNTVRFAVIDPGKDIDIVVLVPQSPLRNEVPIRSLQTSQGSFLMGGECWSQLQNRQRVPAAGLGQNVRLRLVSE